MNIGKLYLHRFDRDDMEGMCWTEYVVSSLPELYGRVET